MSATIGNLPELAEFLNADIYHKDFRPVELREYIKCGADLIEIKKDATDLDDMFVRDRTVSFGVSCAIIFFAAFFKQITNVPVTFPHSL